jgi:hypothetical protein
LPALDGSYDEVAAYLDRYLALGVTKLLLTKVDSEEESAIPGKCCLGSSTKPVMWCRRELPQR